MITWAAGNYATWSNFLGDRLSTRRRALLDRVFTTWPQKQVDRLVGGRGITLVHRDTHPLNFLYPKNEEVDTVRIVDWQSWRVDTGTDDLAYMMACHWYPHYRATLERPLLKRYHQGLLRDGVEEYRWEQCWYDYRASVIRCLFFLLASWKPERPATMWWDRLEKGLLAFKDLNCAELLSNH
jgi:thiamine kinase-like enzyme